jgi:hypothetical protein
MQSSPPSLLDRNISLNLLTYLLTPWCRILFEKLIVTQFVKKYPAFLRNPKVHHRVHKSLPLDPILSQPNPVRHIDSYLPKVHPNVPRTKSHVFFPVLRSYQRISPRHFEIFCNNKKNFTVRGCEAPRPTPKLKGHPLSAVRDCLFNIFAATLRTRTSLHPQPEDAPCRGDKGPT